MELVEFLKTRAEPCPDWLANFTPDTPFDARPFFASRVVYYPGHGGDGQAVRVFSAAHAAHCFIYADYFWEEADIKASLDHPRRHFKGYHTLARISLTPEKLISGNWRPHAQPTHGWATQPNIQPFGFVEVLERDADFGPEHGADRLAILFLGADGHATYDALFCQAGQTKPPYAILLQDHGFGGNYSAFGRDGLMEKIATMTGRKPELLLVAENTKAWEGYEKIPQCDPDIGGRYREARFLFSIVRR